MTSRRSWPTCTPAATWAITLLMLLGGLRAAEVRSLRLANVDMGLRRVRVTGKGGKERIVPVDGVFFTELAAYLREERPPRCAGAECFVVLRGPKTVGGARFFVEVTAHDHR